MLYLFVEEAQFQMTGIQKTLSYLEKEAARRKISLEPISALSEIPGGTPGILLLLGLSNRWVVGQIEAAHRRCLYPIVLSNLEPSACSLPFSLVAMDMDAAMDTCLDYLFQMGCSRPALYGTNPASTGDTWRVHAFLRREFSERDIYACTDSFRETFHRFLTGLASYDSVICAYDYTAVSLIRLLDQLAPEQLRRLNILSFGDSRISSACTPSLTTISHDRKLAATEAIALYERLQRCTDLSSLHILLKSRLEVRDSTFPIQSPAAVSTAQEFPSRSYPPNLLYNERELKDITSVEQLLLRCDDTDLRIIDALLSGQTLSGICDSCHLSETPVKRRLRILQKICGAADRKELVLLLHKYFH